MGSPDGGDPPETLEVSPAELLGVGYLEQVVINVKLVDGEQHPLKDVPVLVSLMGEAHNATLAPGQFNTSEDGFGQVTFTAPDKAGSFDIRFKSPEAEAYVHVAVDPTTAVISQYVAYNRGRTLSTLEATLYQMTDTFNCSDLTGTPIIETGVWSPAEMPIEIRFDGLLEDQSYAIYVTGKNSAGEVRALGCATGVRPNWNNKLLVLVNSPLNAAGTFDIVTSLDTSGSIDGIVDRFDESIDFTTNPAKAILDGISEALAAKDAFAKDAFAQQREEKAWDQLLAQGYFQRVDVAGSVQPVWDAVKAFLSGFKAIGSFELATSDDGDYILYHEINLLQFPRLNGSAPLSYPISKPDRGTGVASVGLTDTLMIDSHRIHLGLGEPLQFLIIDALQNQFAKPELGQALQKIVDCAAVAEFLANPLSDVTDSETIKTGCVIAATGADNQLGDQVTALSQYDLLTFQGTCKLDVPATGNRVDRLISGEFYVIWGNDLDKELYSMSASFEATRLQKRK